MKTEGDFNQWLTRKLKPLKPDTKYIKIADKFTVGISDFLIWRNGKSIAIETKFVKKIPKKDSSNVLSHIFSGQQVTFLEDMHLSGNMAYGLIGVDQELLAFIPYQFIPKLGNWTKEEFMSAQLNFEIYNWKGFERFLTKKLGD